MHRRWGEGGPPDGVALAGGRFTDGLTFLARTPGLGQTWWLGGPDTAPALTSGSWYRGAVGGVSFDGGARMYWPTSPAFDVQNGDYTLLCTFRRIEHGGTSTLLTRDAGDRAWQFNMNSDGSLNLITFGGFTVTNTTAGDCPYGRINTAMMTVVGDNVTAFVNGRVAGRGTGAGTHAAAGLSARVEHGGAHTGTEGLLVGIWRRGMPEDEARLLSADPWQLFAPPRRRLVGSGATNVAVSHAVAAAGIHPLSAAAHDLTASGQMSAGSAPTTTADHNTATATEISATSTPAAAAAHDTTAVTEISATSAPATTATPSRAVTASTDIVVVELLAITTTRDGIVAAIVPAHAYLRPPATVLGELLVGSDAEVIRGQDHALISWRDPDVIGGTL